VVRDPKTIDAYSSIIDITIATIYSYRYYFYIFLYYYYVFYSIVLYSNYIEKLNRLFAYIFNLNNLDYR
jgi:hypothetical protein